MNRNRNNYPFHNQPAGVPSDRSLMIMAFQKQARINARKRFWRNVGWVVICALGSLALTVFMYSRIGV